MKVPPHMKVAPLCFAALDAYPYRFMADLTVLFICPSASRFLTALKGLPQDTRIVAGHTPEAFSKEDRAEARVVLFTGSLGPILQKIYPDLRRVEWLHCLSAGLDAV